MIADAVDTVCTLGVALLAWIAVMVLALVLVLHAAVALAAWPCVAAREALSGALAASCALRALDVEPDRYRPPQRPSWVAA